MFAPDAPARVLRDQQKGPSPDQSYRVTGLESVLVEGLKTTRLKYGLQVLDTPRVAVYNFSYDQFDGGGQIHGGAIKVGNNDRPITGPLFVQTAYADGRQQPDGSYRVSNTDFLGVERKNAPVYLRNATGKNFGDAGVDSKGQKVYLMNATLESGHRMVRAWGGAEIILVNSIVNAAPGRTQIWISDQNATVRYHNTLWCDGADKPSASHPNCRADPWRIEGDRISKEEAAKRVIPLFDNPLPGESPFFATRIDRLEVEYSIDGGPWLALDLPNTGGMGKAPVGDLRWRVPLDLNTGAYRFRARFSLGGKAVGEPSQPVDEQGRAAP